MSLIKVSKDDFYDVIKKIVRLWWIFGHRGVVLAVF